MKLTHRELCSEVRLNNPGENPMHFDNLIERMRSGYFVAYHPVTRLRIGTYDSWLQAANAISEAAA